MSPVHPKVAGATGAAAFAALVIAILKASGVQVDVDLATTITAFVAAAGGFLTPTLKGEIRATLGPVVTELKATEGSVMRAVEPIIRAAEPVVTDAEEFASSPPAPLPTNVTGTTTAATGNVFPQSATTAGPIPPAPPVA